MIAIPEGPGSCLLVEPDQRVPYNRVAGKRRRTAGDPDEGVDSAWLEVERSVASIERVEAASVPALTMSPDSADAHLSGQAADGTGRGAARRKGRLADLAAGERIRSSLRWADARIRAGTRRRLQTGSPRRTLACVQSTIAPFRRA